MTESPPPLRPVALWDADVAHEIRADGSILVWQRGALPDYGRCLSDRIAHWAAVAPDRTWMAERGPDGAWRRTTYAQLQAALPALGQGLLDLGLSVERPLLILSGNSVTHGMMALAAQYAGIPSAAIAPAYATSGEGFAKLAAIRDQITPGAVYAEDTTPFAAALAATLAGLPVIGLTGAAVTHPFATLRATPPGPGVQAAHAATGPDTVAKFMFTSGTTGNPKAVIQTQRMLCSNMAMVADCYAYMRDEPPVVVDWAPWNHVASGSKVFNMVLWNGGTYWLDTGKPSPAGMAQTLQNLREISPNWYFNVPVGYEMLIQAMQADPALAANFFRDVKLLMYAGAAMAEHTWAELDRLAVQMTGQRILLATGLGATETAPFALYCTEPQDRPGNIGVPSKGLVLKLVPVEGRWEARLKGPSITPGYWRNPELSAAAFDDEGFYCLGDALRFAVPGDPARGFLFDGRTAENFKLATGTWVAVGPLRARVIDALQGLALDAVIAGEGQNELGALLVPFRPAIAKLVPDGAALPDAELMAHPALAAHVARLLGDYNARAGGSSLRIARALFLDQPLSLDRGEVTDKGSVNQRAVLRNRADLVERLYAGGAGVIRAARG